jgi:hypothetical protein
MMGYGRIDRDRRIIPILQGWTTDRILGFAPPFSKGRLGGVKICLVRLTVGEPDERASAVAVI